MGCGAGAGCLGWGSIVRGRRGGEAAWEKTQEEPGPRIFQTDWASPTPLAMWKLWGWQQLWWCSDKPYLALKPGRAGWGTEMNQGAGLWFCHQGTRGWRCLDHPPAGPFPIVTPSPGTLLWYPKNTEACSWLCLSPSLAFKVLALGSLLFLSGILPAPFLWAVGRGRVPTGYCERQALILSTWSLLSPGLE